MLFFGGGGWKMSREWKISGGDSERGVAVAQAGRRRHSAKQTERGDSLAWKMQFIMQNEKQTAGKKRR